jgi:3'-phosphoadenosine 5'-phosphosulfate (PAPS) 3'-phosphatase
VPFPLSIGNFVNSNTQNINIATVVKTVTSLGMVGAPQQTVVSYKLDNECTRCVSQKSMPVAVLKRSAMESITSPRAPSTSMYFWAVKR